MPYKPASIMENNEKEKRNAGLEWRKVREEGEGEGKRRIGEIAFMGQSLSLRLRQDGLAISGGVVAVECSAKNLQDAPGVVEVLEEFVEVPWCRWVSGFLLSRVEEEGYWR